jgi:hypothetical protein
MRSEKRKRQPTIQIRVDDAERAALQHNAKLTRSKSVPDFLRRLGLGWQPHLRGNALVVDRDELRRLKISVGQAATLVAQALAAAAAGGDRRDPDDTVRDALDQLRAVNDDIRRALGYASPGDADAAAPPEREG